MRSLFRKKTRHRYILRRARCACIAFGLMFLKNTKNASDYRELRSIYYKSESCILTLKILAEGEELTYLIPQLHSFRSVVSTTRQPLLRPIAVCSPRGTIFRRMLCADLSVRVFFRPLRLAGSRCCITRTSSNC